MDDVLSSLVSSWSQSDVASSIVSNWDGTSIPTSSGPDPLALFDRITSGASSLADSVFRVQQRNLDRDILRTQTQAAADVSKLQAAAQVRAAQYGLTRTTDDSGGFVLLLVFGLLAAALMKGS